MTKTTAFVKVFLLVSGIFLIGLGSVFVYDSNESERRSAKEQQAEETVTPRFTVNPEISYGLDTCANTVFHWESSHKHLAFKENTSNGQGVWVEKVSDNSLSLRFKNVNGEMVELTLSENDNLLEPQNTMRTKFTEILSSKFGQCFVEVAFKVAKSGIIGKDNPSIAPFYHLAKVFYSFVEKLPTRNWDFTRVDEIIFDANAAVNRLKSRQNLNCNTNDWYKLGDGRCDSELNNAGCNFDNGDCCPQTCKDYATPWNGLSPEDNEGNFHPVFDCSSASDSTCVPQCTGDKSKLGDGVCDASLNTESCGFDLGDCCENTCVGPLCGSNGFDCRSGAGGLCFRAGYCDNNYFGMCGLGDACVLSLCGDCRCHFECQDHDQYCSCDGMLSFGCMNVFRDWCD